MTTSPELSLQWQTEEDTRQFAVQLALQLSTLSPEDSLFIELHGDLGTGKTTLVRHLLQAMGVTGRIKSPTYAIVESYEDIPISTSTTNTSKNAPLNIWHFDFYRFNDPLEWEEAGFRDIFASPGIKIAEWPEKAAAELPVADIAILMVANKDESRAVTIRANTQTGQKILVQTKLAPQI